MDDLLENKLRRIVKARLERGRRTAVAKAAGHANGTWVTNWITRVQKHATLDELAAMLRELRVDIGRALASPDATDDLDWEVFGVMGRLETEAEKRLALRLIRSVSEAQHVPQSTPQTAPRPARAGRKGRGTR